MARKTVISIDIGSFNTKITVGSFENGYVNIEKAFAIETTQGSIMDGKLILAEGKADNLRQKLHQALSEHKIKHGDAILTLQSTSTIRRELEIPKVKTNEMESMIRYEIEQYLPIDLNEYVIEYKVQEEKKDNKSRILIAALPKVIAEDCLNLLKAMKLEPRALDINSNAVSKLFGFKQEINNAAYSLNNTAAFIDIGYSNISISILSKGLFQFSRLIPTGGSELTAAIADAFGISIEEAERKKISEANLSKSESGLEPASLNEIIRRIVSRWTEDIMRVFQYYNTRNVNNNIDEIYIYGGTSNLRGITEYIANTANMPTRQIKALSSIILKKQMDSIDLEYYLNSIGAIIRK